MMWVVDTSALIRLFVPDGPVHPDIESALQRAASGTDVVLAPHLVIGRSGQCPAPQAATG